MGSCIVDCGANRRAKLEHLVLYGSCIVDFGATNRRAIWVLAFPGDKRDGLKIDRE